MPNARQSRRVAELLRALFGPLGSDGDVATLAGGVGTWAAPSGGGGGITAEDARDAIGAALVAGTGITITVNDGADTITIATTITQYTDEMARDALGTALTAGANITITPNDGADTITIAVTGIPTQEQIEDYIGALLLDTDTIDLTYVDATPSISADFRDQDAARWVTVRDLDFGSWADTDFAATADGTHALDDGSGSLTWNKLNRTAADGAPGYFRKNAAGDSGDDGGDGLRIVCDASLATTLTTGANTAPQLWIALGTLDPNYDETCEYVLQMHVTRLTDSGTITASQPTRLLLALHAPSGTPTGTAVRVAGVAYRRLGSADWRPCIETSATTDTSRTDQAYSTSNVLSLHLGPKGIQGYSGVYSGGWPTMRSLTCVGFRASAQSSPNWADVYNHRDTRIVIAACSGVSNTGAIDIMVRRLRMLRRRT